MADYAATPGGYVRPSGFEPQPGESAGLGTTRGKFYKSEAYGVWQGAERAYRSAESTFNQYAGYMTDAARSDWSAKLINMSRRFSAEWRKVQGYSEGWTNWGKYIDQGLVWRAQWLHFANEVREVGMSLESSSTDAIVITASGKKTSKKPREVKPGVLKRRKSRVSTRAVLATVKGNPEAAAVAIKASGETAVPPTQADETLLWVGVGVLGLAILWTMIPEESRPALTAR